MPPADLPPGSARGLTVADVAERYRVGADKVRAWIKGSVLKAVNTAAVGCGRPRYVILPEALAAFERARAAAPPTPVKRPERRTNTIDFFPD